MNTSLFSEVARERASGSVAAQTAFPGLRTAFVGGGGEDGLCCAHKGLPDRLAARSARVSIGVRQGFTSSENSIRAAGIPAGRAIAGPSTYRLWCRYHRLQDIWRDEEALPIGPPRMGARALDMDRGAFPGGGSPTRFRVRRSADPRPRQPTADRDA